MRTVELPSFSLPGAVLCEAVRKPSTRTRAGERDRRFAMTLEERFWSKVDKSGGPDACWLWRGWIRADGYGDLHAAKPTLGTRLTHRVVWILTHGTLPAELKVCHKCDNPPCCNPSHLFLGTYQDNIADCVAKGRNRGACGERNPLAKLTWDIVALIRTRLANGDQQRRIAKDLGVSDTTIRNIAKGRTWTTQAADALAASPLVADAGAAGEVEE